MCPTLAYVLGKIIPTIVALGVCMLVVAFSDMYSEVPIKKTHINAILCRSLTRSHKAVLVLQSVSCAVYHTRLWEEWTVPSIK